MAIDYSIIDANDAKEARKNNHRAALRPLRRLWEKGSLSAMSLSLASSTSFGAIVVAADHAGFALKGPLIEWLRAERREVIDLGTHSPDSVDYPDYAAALAQVIREGKADFGVLICGSGIGVSIAANRFPGVRAAVCHDVTTARLARQHNNANVLALGVRLLGDEVARDCLFTFLKTPFDGGERHLRRLAKMG
ncbi:ribose 5-phosphate isomerase B [Azospirillaceae bacterium]